MTIMSVSGGGGATTMAKTRKKTKSKTKTKIRTKKRTGSSKKASPVKKVRPPARRKPKPAPAAGLAAADPKMTAVIASVNGVLNANRAGWDDNGNGNNLTMNKDLHYADSDSMTVFLDAVAVGLGKRKYTL